LNTVVYGISNCDTVKTARRWLNTRHVSYRFHDLRNDGLDEEKLRQWLDRLGWEALVNRRSTSWKALGESDRAAMSDETALRHILATPTLIKRPLLEHGEVLEVGFKEARYLELFGG
jgi:Spx/MgsR family transcriptional regulator